MHSALNAKRHATTEIEQCREFLVSQAEALHADSDTNVQNPFLMRENTKIHQDTIRVLSETIHLLKYDEPIGDRAQNELNATLADRLGDAWRFEAGLAAARYVGTRTGLRVTVPRDLACPVSGHTGSGINDPARCVLCGHIFESDAIYKKIKDNAKSMGSIVCPYDHCGVSITRETIEQLHPVGAAEIAASMAM